MDEPLCTVCNHAQRNHGCAVYVDGKRCGCMHCNEVIKLRARVLELESGAIKKGESVDKVNTTT